MGISEACPGPYITPLRKGFDMVHGKHGITVESRVGIRVAAYWCKPSSMDCQTQIIPHSLRRTDAREGQRCIGRNNGSMRLLGQSRGKKCWEGLGRYSSVPLRYLFALRNTSACLTSIADTAMGGTMATGGPLTGGA